MMPLVGRCLAFAVLCGVAAAIICALMLSLGVGEKSALFRSAVFWALTAGAGVYRFVRIELVFRKFSK